MKIKTKVGVVGVGHLGKHHARHFASLPGAELVGVFDLSPEKAVEVAKANNTRAFESLEKLLDEVEAVSVVTPTEHHFSVARFCIENRKHVFIEKPISKTVEEAESLIALANKNNIIIQVGHIERVNPALLPLKQFDMKARYIEVQRLAPFTSRGTDVPVVLDLMIHDIDLVLAFVDSPVKKIQANGVSIMTNSVDIANARIEFQNGAVANITSSRVAKDRVRKIKVFQQDLYVTIDFLIGLTEIYRVMDADQTDPSSIMSAPIESNGKHRQIFYEKPKIKKEDALKLELQNFLETTQGRAKPIVDGKAGKNALDVAVQIHNKILDGIN